MGDVARERLGDPYAGTYDLDGYPAILAESEQALAELRAYTAAGKVHPSTPPWSAVEDDIAQLEREISDLRAAIHAGERLRG